jgi:hypothetical protein
MNEAAKLVFDMPAHELKELLEKKAQEDEGWFVLYMIWQRGRAWGMDYALRMTGKTKAQIDEFFAKVDAGADRYQLLGMKPTASPEVSNE